MPYFVSIKMKFIYLYSSVVFVIKSINICEDKVHYNETIIWVSLVLKYMFYIFPFKGYSRRKSKYSDKITQSNLYN